MLRVEAGLFNNFLRYLMVTGYVGNENEMDVKRASGLWIAEDGAWSVEDMNAKLEIPTRISRMKCINV